MVFSLKWTGQKGNSQTSQAGIPTHLAPCSDWSLKGDGAYPPGQQRSLVQELELARDIAAVHLGWRILPGELRGIILVLGIHGNRMLVQIPVQLPVARSNV